MQGQGLVGMLRGLWQDREQLDAGGAVADGFQIGRAVAGVLARLLPVGNGLLRASRLGIVMRQQLGLSLDDGGKLRLEHLSDALVVLLPGPLQQRLIRCVLDQSMLEDIGRVRQQATLVEHFCVEEPAQFPL